VVLLDDIVTTGATLTAVTAALASAGIPVSAAAVLAATRRRSPPQDRGERPAKVYRTRGDAPPFSG
jgi:adenine/guanine phosphoribosyltransferase-like PRPP-binding protein